MQRRKLMEGSVANSMHAMEKNVEDKMTMEQYACRRKRWDEKDDGEPRAMKKKER